MSSRSNSATPSGSPELEHSHPSLSPQPQTQPPKPPTPHRGLSRSASAHVGNTEVPGKIYVLSADGSSLFLLDPSKPSPHEEPPPYAASLKSPRSVNSQYRSLPPTPGIDGLPASQDLSSSGVLHSGGVGGTTTTGLGVRIRASSDVRGSVRSNVDGSQHQPQIQGQGQGQAGGVIFPNMNGSTISLNSFPLHRAVSNDTAQLSIAGTSRHRASTMSAINPRSSSVSARPRLRGTIGSVSYSLPNTGTIRPRSAQSIRRGIGGDENTPLLLSEGNAGVESRKPSRGFWRSVFCGEVEIEEEGVTLDLNSSWKRYWRPVGKGLYWYGLIHLYLLNFPLALFVWPFLVAGTLAGTALLITLPIGAAVWWLTLILARTAARIETNLQIHYHSPLNPEIMPTGYHPIFYRLRPTTSLPNSPQSQNTNSNGPPISPISVYAGSENGFEFVWDKRFMKCSYAMFCDHYSYSALSYFLLIKPILTLLSTIALLALFPVALATIFGLPVFLRAARRWGKWQAGVAMENL